MRSYLEEVEVSIDLMRKRQGLDGIVEVDCNGNRQKTLELRFVGHAISYRLHVHALKGVRWVDGLLEALQVGERGAEEIGLDADIESRLLL